MAQEKLDNVIQVKEYVDISLVYLKNTSGSAYENKCSGNTNFLSNHNQKPFDIWKPRQYHCKRESSAQANS